MILLSPNKIIPNESESKAEYKSCSMPGNTPSSIALFITSGNYPEEKNMLKTFAAFMKISEFLDFNSPQSFAITCFEANFRI